MLTPRTWGKHRLGNCVLAYVASYLFDGESVDESRHRSTLNRLVRTKSAVTPASRDVLVLKPGNLAVERIIAIDVLELRSLRCLIVCHLRITEEESRHCSTIYRYAGTISSILIPSCNALLGHPHNLFVERMRRIDIFKR